MLQIFNTICTYVYWYIRPLLKWFLHKTTKLCELQRICYGYDMGSQRTFSIEYSLKKSRTPVLISLFEELKRLSLEGKLQGETGSKLIDFAVTAIIKAKKIDPKFNADFIYPITVSLAQIFGYKQLLTEVETIRRIQYSDENIIHEEKLLRLWNCLMPEQKLESRITRQWGIIGFQGDNPKTDFRGMGLLGLENLLYFATEYNGAARHVLSHSQHPTYGYSFAIVGINLTSLAYELLKDGLLKVHFFNTVQGRPGIHHFHQVYTYLFFEFDKYWLKEKPKDIMEFGRIRDSFKKFMSSMLKDSNTVLKCNFAVDIV